MNRIFLPTGASFTHPGITPTNWKEQTASTKTDWRIRYRYFDQGNPKGVQFTVKNMNRYKVIAQRREATTELYSLLMAKLKEGWNPITGRDPEPVSGFEIDQMTEVNAAFQYAYEKKVCGQKTRIQLRKALHHIKVASIQLGYDRLAISEIRRRHVKLILDRIGMNKGGWSSATNFNQFRSSMKMLFDVLDEVEANEMDPVTKIRKMPAEHRLRITLTKTERTAVNKHLKKNYPDFYRFLHIFFHSGARVSELFRLKGSDLDIPGQRFKIWIIKGKRKTEVWKTIKDIALPFWKQLKPRADQFIFSEGLLPGPVAVNPIQVSRRWRLLVKEKLGIKADFYSLKHSHTSEVVDKLGDQKAASHNSHTSTAMVVKIYDVNRSGRDHKTVKGLKNKFN